MSIEKNSILTVDDDEAMRILLSKVLKAGGYLVTVAESGEEALQLLKSFTPELIIADVMMPGMGGYELCRQVRSMGILDIPFIFCSALGKLPERIKGLWIGADDYVVKPINSTELLIKIEKLIDKSRKLREMACKVEEVASQGIMSGTLENIKVGELLQVINFLGLPQLFFQLTTFAHQIGEIYLEKRQLIHAQIGEIVGMKAFSRILGWENGKYRVESKTWPFEHTISGSLEERLFYTATQLDEYLLLRNSLSQHGNFLKIEYSPDLLMRQFDGNVNEILNIIESVHDMDKVLDISPFTDLETTRIIAELYTVGIVNISDRL